MHELQGKRSHMQLKTKKVATQPKPTSSGLANANGPTISSPPSKVLTPSVNQNQIALSASDDKVCKSEK